MRNTKFKNGSVLVLVVVSLVVLAALGLGLLTVARGVRYRAISLNKEAAAMFAADAGYEKAVFWMSQQRDLLSALQQSSLLGTRGVLNFPDADCDYQVGIFTFVGARPVYRVISNGHSGRADTTVDVLVLQAMSGWDIGMCRVASGKDKTSPSNFTEGEIIDIPLHINKLDESPDTTDIYVSGNPRFLQSVAVSESRYDISGSDKYISDMDLFEGGIYFDQPDCRITDEASIQTKVARFRNSTKPQFRFKPVDNTPPKSLQNPNAAVQLEFFVEGGIGKVRITNNCTVCGFLQDKDNRTWDFRIKPGSGGKEYQRYDIYAYHFISGNAVATGERFTRRIDQTYVTQAVGPVQSAPGGQIFVDGNVIIGGDQTLHNGDQVVKGRITIVATGNIWLADSIVVDGPHDADGRPSHDNPNVLGLVAQGVIKIVDPGMSAYNTGGRNDYPGPALVFQTDIPQPTWAVQPESDDSFEMVVVSGSWFVVRGSIHDSQYTIHDSRSSTFALNPPVTPLMFTQNVKKAFEMDMFRRKASLSGGYDTGDRNSYIGPSNDEQLRYVGQPRPRLPRWQRPWRGGRRRRPGPGQGKEQIPGFEYVPIGRYDGGKSETYDRHLPNPMVIEASITAGGGGFGAENVERNVYGGRKEAPGTGAQNDLIVRGAVIEALRGVVELIDTDGYLKRYYLDERLFEGILPGDMWLRSKFIPAPAGWRDY